jgi:crotonobetainyl-CoA:carnitine CoA-transferase CaiB-like acyl-CoA transferase
MPDALLRPKVSGEGAQAAANEHPVHSPHGVYRCAGDDTWLAIGIEDDRKWRRLCDSIPGVAHLAHLSEDGRRAAAAGIDVCLREWAGERDPIEAMELLQAAGVPASASYTTNDLFGDKHLWERGFYKQLQGPPDRQRFLPGLPWLWGDGALVQPRAAPGLGEHNEPVLRRLGGLESEDIERLRSAGAFGRA